MFIEILLVLPVVDDIFDIVSNTFYLQSPELTNIGQLTEVPTWIQDTVAHAEAIQSYIVDLKAMENTTKTDVIKTHFGSWMFPLSTNNGGKRRHNNKCGMDYVLHHSLTRYVIFLVTVTGSLYIVQNHQKSSCWGDDPTIRNTRNLHPGTTSRIKKHELAAPWSMRVFLHCAFLWRQCQLLVQLSNVFWLKTNKNKILHLSIGKLGKNFKKNLKLPWMNPISGASKSVSYTTFVNLL